MPLPRRKYCWYATNVNKNWDPTRDANSWDRAADDGTADFLLNCASTGGCTSGVDFSSKDNLFINFVYTYRRTIEALTAGGVPYEVKALHWEQGAGDQSKSWSQHSSVS